MQELDSVALARDVPEYGLIAGDLGTVLQVSDDASAVVEFVDSAGGTFALLTLNSIDIYSAKPGTELANAHIEPLPAGAHIPIVDARLRLPTVRDAQLSHIDESGRTRMVDVTEKDETLRVAVAKGRIVMLPETLRLLLAGEIAKGNVLTTAQIAGVMAAKRTHELIPMCHPLLLTGIDVTLTPDEGANTVEIEATVRTTGKTGVEMEALTAVSIAGLTIYDMCKAVDRGMRLEDVRLVSKSGGASGDYRA
jgi:cyclic pyranopterin monophosphate synthase